MPGSQCPAAALFRQDQRRNGNAARNGLSVQLAIEGHPCIGLRTAQDKSHGPLTVHVLDAAITAARYHHALPQLARRADDQWEAWRFDPHKGRLHAERSILSTQPGRYRLRLAADRLDVGKHLALNGCAVTDREYAWLRGLHQTVGDDPAADGEASL
jgi:hypothetical protein